jgi:hypothetical protein
MVPLGYLWSPPLKRRPARSPAHHLSAPSAPARSGWSRGQRAAKLLTCDEARRIAANIARLPGLLRLGAASQIIECQYQCHS